MALYRETRDYASGKVTTRRYYKGRKQEIQAKANLLETFGWATSLDHDGAVWELTATYGGDASTPAPDNPVDNPVESPIEQWSCSTEPEGINAFANNLVAKEAALFEKNTAGRDIGTYRQIIEKAVAAGNRKVLVSAGLIPQNYPRAALVYDALCRGRTGSEVEAFGLRRTRNYSDAYQQRVKLDAGQFLLKHDQLVELYNIPAIIAGKLPESPVPLSEVPNSVFIGWRQRHYSYEYESPGRIVERIDWLFAAHDLAFYQTLDSIRHLIEVWASAISPPR